MTPTIQTVNLLRGIWADWIIPTLEADLHKIQSALVHAETMDQVRNFQGWAEALASFKKLPERLATQIEEETAHD
jgi:hypothetical protein